jgi:hypothetical protein
MSTHVERTSSSITSGGKDIAERVKDLDWERILRDLDVQGNARIKRLITSAECDTLAQLYPKDRIFRSTDLGVESTSISVIHFPIWLMTSGLPSTPTLFQ